MSNTNGFLLKVEDLKTYFPVKKGLLRRTVGYVKAVDGVSFAVKPRSHLRPCRRKRLRQNHRRKIHPPPHPRHLRQSHFRQYRCPRRRRLPLRNLRSNISLIFQDPFGSLNPRMTVGSIVGEPLKVHKKITGTDLTEHVCLILSKVGLSPDAYKPLSSRILRRPATTYRHRPRPYPPAETCHLR